MKRLAATACIAAALVAVAGSASATTKSPGESADGRTLTGRILVTINGNLFTIKPDGTGLRQLSTGGGIGDADVSPDGRRIAYHKGGYAKQDLYVMRADGTGIQRLTSAAGFDDAYASWAPDSKRIAFQRVGVTNPQNGGIAVMQATPGAAVQIIKKNPAVPDDYSDLYKRPDWSPKGDKIAVSYEMNSDHTYTSGTVITTTGADTGKWIPGDQAEFDPTGTWVSGIDWDYDAGDTSYMRNIVTGRIVYFRPRYSWPYPSDMVWSPDGAMLAVRYDTNGDNRDDLCLMKPDGTIVKVLKKGSATLNITPRSWRNF